VLLLTLRASNGPCRANLFKRKFQHECAGYLRRFEPEHPAYAILWPALARLLPRSLRPQFFGALWVWAEPRMP
jgi:hypothetical protein